jgi:glutathione S-transferase
MDDEEGLKEAREDFLGKLKELTGEMDKTGPFFFGSEPSLIDFVIAPWVVSFFSFSLPGWNNADWLCEDAALGF